VNDVEHENSPKINWIINKIVEENKSNKNNKCVIYSSFLTSGQKLLMKRLDDLHIRYAKIDGTMTKKRRDEAQKHYNQRKVNILLISKTGGEGLDLKETNHLFILEPFWNEALLEQVKGRVARFRSHIHLPKAQQKVDIWTLYMLKPGKKSISADTYLKQMAQLKKVMTSSFIDQLKTVSIEAKKC